MNKCLYNFILEIKKNKNDLKLNFTLIFYLTYFFKNTDIKFKFPTTHYFLSENQVILKPVVGYTNIYLALVRLFITYPAIYKDSQHSRVVILLFLGLFANPIHGNAIIRL